MLCIPRQVWVGDVASMEVRRGTYRASVENTDRRMPLGRPRCRRKNNIKMDFPAPVWGMDWIDVTQDRDRWRSLMNAAINLRVS